MTVFAEVKYGDVEVSETVVLESAPILAMPFVLVANVWGV